MEEDSGGGGGGGGRNFVDENADNMYAHTRQGRAIAREHWAVRREQCEEQVRVVSTPSTRAPGLCVCTCVGGGVATVRWAAMLDGGGVQRRQDGGMGWCGRDSMGPGQWKGGARLVTVDNVHLHAGVTAPA